MGDIDDDPMHAANCAPRCLAKSKRSGRRCRAPAVTGWAVCRMHGARGGGPRGPSNGNYRHGDRTQEAERCKRELAELLRAWTDLAKLLLDERTPIQKPSPRFTADGTRR